MRISDGGGLLGLPVAMLLAGCGPQPSDPFGDGDAERIVCRTGDATDFARNCTVERTEGPDGLVLTVRHPDGGFRRLLVTRDGSGIAAADGAEAARVTLDGAEGILVSLGNDSYRLPATVKPARVP